MRFRQTLVSSLAIAALLLVPTAWAHDEDDYDSDYAYSGSSCDVYVDSGHDPHWNALNGYGSWHYVPSVRARLWFPYVSASWRPYYYGHWIHTSLGMTWVSHEPWGEIPHHYGQWIYVDHYGWGWVPGYEYSPAWVTWSVADGYVGWAPCPPVGYRYPRYHRYFPGYHVPRYGFSGSFGYHASGLDFSLWIFVSDRHFYGAPVHRHVIPARHTRSLFKHKKVLPVGSHLNVDYARKITKEKIRTVKVDRKKTRAGDRSLTYWKPREQRDLIRSGQKAAERSYTKRREIERRFAGSKDSRSTPQRDVRRQVITPDKKELAKAEKRSSKKAKESAESRKSSGKRDKSSAERSERVESNPKRSPESKESAEKSRGTKKTKRARD